MTPSTRALADRQQIEHIHRARELRHQAKFKSGPDRDCLLSEANRLEQTVRMIRQHVALLSN